MGGTLKKYWKTLANLEVAAINYSYTNLQELDSLSEKCIELAISVPFLKGERSGCYSLSVATLFLKRAISDFRGAWLLLNWGYPYQAACAVASLYEHALIVNCICDRDDLAKVAMSGRDGDMPWQPKKLAKMSACKDLFGVVKTDFPNDSNFERAWRHEYWNYKFLCKMKHPTVQQLNDEASMTLLDSNTYVVAAKPDIRKESLGLKKIIMFIAISKIFSAVKNVAKATKCSHDSEEEKLLFEELVSLNEKMKLFLENSKVLEVPIKVYGYDFIGKK